MPAPLSQDFFDRPEPQPRRRIQATYRGERRIKLVFSIADTGAGMSRSHLAIILGRGRTPDASESDASGLSAAVKLARLMGGEITARSEMGQGSVFNFAIEAPVVAAAQSPRDAA